MTRSLALRALFAAALVFLAAVAIPGQVRAGTTGTITGLVYDDAGKAIPGVVVTVSSPSQNGSATSDNHGSFGFLALAPDSYNVTLAKDGYGSTTTTGVVVTSDQSLSLTFTLKKSGS